MERRRGARRKGWQCCPPCSPEPRLPRMVGAALGLVALVVIIAIQLSFLSFELAKMLVGFLFAPLTPFALSWIVNHLYATNAGLIHVYFFRFYKWFAKIHLHSASLRFDVETEDCPVAIHTVACLIDNYCYLIVDLSSGPPFSVVAVDPAEPSVVLEALRELSLSHYGSKENCLHLKAILTTHRHWDHSAGNTTLLRRLESCTRVYGGRKDRVPGCTHPLDDGDLVSVGNLRIRAIAVPCHTVGSMAFQIQGKDRDVLFTGDTLFCGGCGAPFEGDQNAMIRCFQRLWVESPRPQRTLLFPGHEYSENLLPEYFRPGSMLHIPNNFRGYDRLSTRFWRAHRSRRYHNPPLPTVPSLMDEEIAFNTYFQSIHTAADYLGSVLRKHRMHYLEQARERDLSHRQGGGEGDRSMFPRGRQSPGDDASASVNQTVSAKAARLTALLQHEAVREGEQRVALMEATRLAGEIKSLASSRGHQGTSGDRMGADPENGDENSGWMLSVHHQQVIDGGDDYYCFEVTLEQLMDSLQALAAGGDRVAIRDLYRAFTTLGTSKPLRHSDALRLIDVLNIPDQVLETPFDEVPTSDEAILVEHVASILLTSCDPSPVPRPSNFLALCRCCKGCRVPGRARHELATNDTDVETGNTEGPRLSKIGSLPSMPIPNGTPTAESPLNMEREGSVEMAEIPPRPSSASDGGVRRESSTVSC